MSRLIQRELVIQASSIHGRGVFADEAFSVGDVLEECHLLTVPRESRLLTNYLFKLTDTESVLPLGAGAIYNHADQPNAKVDIDHQRNVMVIRAVQPITSGEEIFISYGKQWFDARKCQPKQARLPYRVKQWCVQSACPRFLLVFSALFLLKWMA